MRINSRFDLADALVSRARFDDMTLVGSGLLTGYEVDVLRAAVLPALAADAPPFTWFKTHEAWGRTAGGTPCFAGIARAAVYLVRDPRDVAASLAHHNSASADRTIDFMNDPDATTARASRRQGPHLRQKIGDWSSHVRSWLDQTDIPVHLVRYEDLRRDTAGELAAALDFAGQSAPPCDIQRAWQTATSRNCKGRRTPLAFGSGCLPQRGSFDVGKRVPGATN